MGQAYSECDEFKHAIYIIFVVFKYREKLLPLLQIYLECNYVHTHAAEVILYKTYFQVIYKNGGTSELMFFADVQDVLYAHFTKMSIKEGSNNISVQAINKLFKPSSKVTSYSTIDISSPKVKSMLSFITESIYLLVRFIAEELTPFLGISWCFTSHLISSN